MTITIEQIEDGVIKVNGKPVIRDLEYNWIANAEISSKEKSVFHSFLKLKKEYPGLVKVEFNF